MRKILAVLLTACILLAVCSCGDNMKKGNMDTKSIAEAVINAEKAMRGYNVMTVESGTEYFAGLKVAPIGYEEAVKFSSPMMPPPNVGYVFKLAENADVEAFKKQLRENADMGWGICVFDNKMIIESQGNYVLFALYSTGGDIDESTEGRLKTAFKNCF